MEPASHARIDSVTVEGLEDVFSPEPPAQELVARPFQSAANLLNHLRQVSDREKASHRENEKSQHQEISAAPKSEAQESTERALATAKAIAGCLDVRSEAVIEHHTVRKSPKGKKKKKTVEEWRIKWTPKSNDESSPSQLASVDQHERGLFDHVFELLRQNSQLIAKLEAATYRIGYLEAELESLRNQAGYSDCDAQVAELPVAKPAIRAISERRVSNSRVAAPDSRFSSSADFWDEEPVLNGFQVPSQKMEEEPLPVETVKKPVEAEEKVFGKELETPEQSGDYAQTGSIFNSGVFNWLPPRA